MTTAVLGASVGYYTRTLEKIRRGGQRYRYPPTQICRSRFSTDPSFIVGTTRASQASTEKR